MHAKVARIAGLAGLGAAALGLAGATIAPALASSTVDTSGSAAVTLARPVVTGLARAGIVALPTGPGTASIGKGGERIVLTVSGGDATVVGAAGTLDLAGSLELLDGTSGKSVTLTKLALSYDSESITGVVGHRTVTIGDVEGSINGSTVTGPPASQTFTASAIVLTKAGARFLNTQLRTRYFKAGRSIGSLSAAYDTGTAS